MEREFVPVKVIANNMTDTWFIDTTHLSLGELLNLKEELKNKSDSHYIDMIVESRVCTSSYYQNNARQNKRDNKKFARQRIRHR